MIEINIKRKKKLKENTTLSMHVDRELLTKFRSKCVNDFAMKHTDILRNFIEDVVNGTIVINVGE